MRHPALLLLSALLVLPACATAERAADDALDGLEEVGDAVAYAATQAYEGAREALGAGGVSPDARIAVARVVGPEGSSSLATGTVTFVELADGGVYVDYDVRGLEPGAHGLHVHENGSCAPADTDGDGTPEPAGAAGGHFNPGDAPHGAPSDPRDERHAGDLGNITVGPDRSARGTLEDDVLSFDGPTSPVGRAMMVHGGRDDLTSQPSGDAGGRVACGVVRLVRGG